jgi:hypothetical protein
LKFRRSPQDFSSVITMRIESSLLIPNLLPMKQFPEARKVLTLVAFLAAFAAHGQTWTSLFNGKDLTGWKQLNGKAEFKVKNGEIVGTTTRNQPNSFLATDSYYDDFILELEFRLDDEMNSGVQFRSESKPTYKDGRVHGYQVEIDPSDRAWTGGIYDEARREWLYPMELNPAGKKALKTGEWNKVRIECLGAVIRVWVNGVATSNLVDNVTPTGFIALQVHAIGEHEKGGKKIRWRNIRIQTTDLRPSPDDTIFVVNLVPNAISEQERSNGWNLLWDGKSTRGWRAIDKESFPADRWELKDGVLAVQKGAQDAGGDIITRDEFGPFDLQFEFKLAPGTNTGIRYLVSEGEGQAFGLEYCLLDDEHHPGTKKGVAGNRTLASLCDLKAAEKIDRARHPIGEWNQGRIIVFPGKKVEHWLNGYKVLSYERGSQEFNESVANSQYAKISNFGLADEGGILLQGGGLVSFRSIKVKELK